MAHSAPGKHYRKGITLLDLFAMFPDDDAAEAWFIACRWPDGVRCPKCDSANVARKKHPTMPLHCGDCRKFFSVKTGSVMESSKVGCQKWAIAIYAFTTGIKGTSSMKLHRDIGVTQKTAWHMAHRIRTCWENAQDPFVGPTEVDETYIGGKERNKHPGKKLRAGRGIVGKTAIIGARDRETGRVQAQLTPFTDKAELQGFVSKATDVGSIVYTDEHPSYVGMPYRSHWTVRHSVGEYVRQQAHTNGIESFWALMKRGFDGTYHQMSVKHLNRYVTEFSGRYNSRPKDTEEQMAGMVQGMVGKRLKYEDLVA